MKEGVDLNKVKDIDKINCIFTDNKLANYDKIKSLLNIWPDEVNTIKNMLNEIKLCTDRHWNLPDKSFYLKGNEYCVKFWSNGIKMLWNPKNQ